jgi:mannitol/fructose-specific phosphotransferase system IIA component (Ntr-type)
MIAMLKLNYWCKTEEEKMELASLLDANEEAFRKQLKSSTNARELLGLLKRDDAT